MAAKVVLRGEERVSQRAIFVLFPFLAHLCLHLLYSILLYIAAPFLTLACMDAWRTSAFFASSCILRKRKKLLYLLLGPLSFDKVCLSFDQGAEALINKTSKIKMKTIFRFL